MKWAIAPTGGYGPFHEMVGRPQVGAVRRSLGHDSWVVLLCARGEAGN